jgi:hypothetical protein
MTTTNLIYDAIEDELIRHCEKTDRPLPPRFEIHLADEEFSALLAGGLRNPSSGHLIPPTATRVSLTLLGCVIRFRADKDPDDWELTKH